MIVTEYNAKLRDKIEWVSDYNKDGEWVGDDNFGASFNHFQKCYKKNYSLVCCNITGVNAFFVRNDLINEKFIKNFTPEFHYQPLRLWLTKNLKMN